LLFRGTNWSGRNELADLLYPNSDASVRRSSLRQSLLRLKRWLGNEAIEEVQGRIRLAENKWTYDCLLANGEAAPSPMIAPGISHPWIEAVRNELAPIAEPMLADEVESFARAVEETASVDADTARSLLVGGTNLTACLPPDRLGHLLRLTQPKDRRDPLTIDHIELKVGLYDRLGCYRDAKEAQARAYRLASQQHIRDRMIRAGAMMLFYEIEDGQMGEASAWIDHLEQTLKADTRSLLFCNAKAAFLWNMNRLDDAIIQMRQAIRRIPSTDRLTKLHFYTNLTVLYAEARKLDLVDESLAEARSLVIDRLDVFRAMAIKLGEATRLMYSSCVDEAIALFDELIDENKRRECKPGYWYASEAKAEALALRGDLAEAVRLWQTTERSRLSQCTRLTPRLLARKMRIFRPA
jgi:tetratricopeptide (TPR) repeat protein